MKFKALLLTGMVTAAGGLMAQAADSVYSVNVVGYVNVTITNAFSIVANPVSATNNNLQTILPGAPTDTVVFKFNGSAFAQFTKRSSGNWTGTGVAAAQFNPGEGFFVRHPLYDSAPTTPVTLSFIGEVPTGTLNVSIPTGFSLLASPVPQAGKIQTDFGIPAETDDLVYRMVNGAYAQSTKRASGAWTGSGEPNVGVGEGFWYFNDNSAKTWSRTFNVSE